MWAGCGQDVGGKLAQKFAQLTTAVTVQVGGQGWPACFEAPPDRRDALAETRLVSARSLILTHATT